MPVLDSFRLVGSGGSNRAMEAELKRIASRLGLKEQLGKPARVDEQTLVYPFDPALVHAALGFLRTPSRVLWDVLEARAERLEPLYDEVLDYVLDERPGWLADGVGISIAATDVREFPASGNQIRGTIKNALLDGAKQLGRRVVLDAERPDLSLTVRGTNGPLVLSIDLNGGSLHRRGYRLEAGLAPLKENLAAQILMLARWDPRTELLLDPMAGSGTIPIEGALMALGRRRYAEDRAPPGLSLPPFSTLAALPAELYPDAEPHVVAVEIDPELAATLERNAVRAEVRDRLVVQADDFRSLNASTLKRLVRRSRPPTWSGEDKPGGLLVANPPHGERLQPEDLEALLGGLGKLLGKLGARWRAAILSSHPELEALVGQPARMKKPMSLGPIQATLYLFGAERAAGD